MVEVPSILPNQSCGDCTVCCQHLIIDAPGLTKLAGDLCKNAKPGCGCAIYAGRPKPCRDFLCSWRLLPLPEEWRPDRCQILVIPEPEDLERGVKQGTKFYFFGRLDRIFWRPFIEFVSTLIAQDRQVYISIPGDHGHCAHMLPIYPAQELKQSIASHDYAAVVGVVAALVQRCRDTSFDPVVFKNRNAAAPLSRDNRKRKAGLQEAYADADSSAG